MTESDQHQQANEEQRRILEVAVRAADFDRVAESEAEPEERDERPIAALIVLP
jgi:hypothetical protein